MSIISFDKVLKIISTILSILSYAIGLLSGKEGSSSIDENVE